MLKAGIQPSAFVYDFPGLDPRLHHSGMTVKTGFLEVHLFVFFISHFLLFIFPEEL